MTLKNTVIDIAEKARKGSYSLMSLSTGKKNQVLQKIAQLLIEEKKYIQGENRKDIAAGEEKGLSPAMLDRLTLSDSIIESMVSGLAEICSLPDPVGKFDGLVKRPNGLLVGRMSVPLGVIAMIYESRPNVTIDAAALCLKAGNSVILRGGSEAIHSNLALATVLQKALDDQGVDRDCIQVIPVTDREAVNHLLTLEEQIDLVIPRGGEGLIRFVCNNSSIPVLKHYKGVCHIYVDKDGDLEKAIPVILNSKTHRPGVCNALEGLLIHKSIAEKFIPLIADSLGEKGVKMLGCPSSVALSSDIVPAGPDDWGREFLDLTLCVKIVEGFDEAKEYIRKYGSQHTESIITENYTTAQRFINEIDASAVMVNSSTRFNDGGQLGLGAEIGISTTKLHAYGPMGLDELTTKKFVVYGQGQVRV
ncbi:gamma-glutamyl phosphate reductase [Desulfomarina profundi]|uniref:Gamma-glutamyl phosphate reductase n=1 Tax=Desulfomarina profundi TaxID=2772557 RepID=A0A8D5FHS2_9BACT|nr:glutamate-5-semialdehyde dehydrogenase [Desulfomarina profundi]BCL60856.1 gamma-glutamyl phosphate reductase [Desulfomarina profundi]